jgi:ATPase subunit of ABC transporter with duplicated ATPase domains
MIQLTDLGKRFGPKVLFSGVTLKLNPGQRYGLVGANGSGKTTLLKMLTGEEAPDEGQISFAKELKLGFLRQDHFGHETRKIVHVAMQGDPEVFAALTELDAETHPADSSPATPEQVERIAHLTDLVSQRDGYTLESRAREILVGLGLPQEKLDQPLSVLSGGYKLRVLLARVLTGRPDILLLDEPTNHLDIVSIRWLEQFLGSYKGCAVVISHDRRFLDVVATRILDVDYRTVTDYPGNYTKFLSQKELAAEQRDAEVARAEKQIAEKKAFVERFRAKATKARQAQSRAKQIEKIEVREVVRSSRQAPAFRFDQFRPTGKDVLGVEGVDKSYGQHRVLSQVSFDVRRAERIALIGENGIGKSTLLKILTDNLSADRGSVTWGVHARVGYFAQDHHDLLTDPKLTPLDFVWGAAPEEGTSTIRGQLGRMLISGDEVEKKVTALSGGEAARVIFARLCLQKPNVLLLDEPTNHLDIEAIEALAEALQAFEGTLLFVSHDRWFVQRIATRIIELKADGLHDFRGTYDEYLERQGTDHLDVGAVSLKAKAPAQSGDLDAGRKPAAPLDHKERKKLTNRLKALPKRRDEVLAKIDRLEARKAEIHALYAKPEFFQEAPAQQRSALSEEEESIDQDLAGSLKTWEELEEELHRLAAVLE